LIAFLEINGRGGEIVMFPLSSFAYEYWLSRDEGLLIDYLCEGNNGMHPQDADFAIDNNNVHRPWYELDDLGHFFGAHPEFCDVQIVIEVSGKRKKILNNGLVKAVTKSKSKMITKSHLKKNLRDRVPAVQIFSYEKGCFFNGKFEFNSNKDFQKLEFQITTFSQESLVTSVMFDGKEIEDLQGGTTGKGLFAKLCKI
jgi:hypothetical protein